MTTPNQNTAALQGYAGTFSKALIAQTLNALDIASDCKVILNLTAPLNLTKLIVNGGIRPLDTSISKANKPGRVWSKRILTPRTGMKLFSVIPAELQGTWMSEQLDPNAKDVPFAEFVWTQEFAKLGEEINDTVGKMQYHGAEADFDPTIAYAVGNYFVYGPTREIYKVLAVTTAGQTPDSNAVKFQLVTAQSICDGPLTIIANELSAANLFAVNTGAINPGNVIASLQAIDASAPEAIRNKKRIMRMSRNIYEMYTKAYDAAFGKPRGNILYQEDMHDMTYLYGTDNLCELRPCSWMAGSQRVFMTLPDNLLMGTNLLSDVSGIGNMIPTLHGFDAICRFILSFQFADLEVLYVNDQA